MEFANGQYDFKKDIITGEQGQKFIRTFLEQKGFIYVDECNTNEYDLKMSYQSKEYTYEIKTDVYKTNTGNMVIEFESRGKPSGISVTKADFFVTYFPFLGEVWNISSNDLKRLINDIKPMIFEHAGDQSSNTRLYRLKKSEVASHFKVHKVDK